MSLYGSRTYTADLDAAVEAAVGIGRLFGSSVLVSGASGLVGSYLAYHEPFEKAIGIYGSSYTNTMMVDLGENLYFAAGSDRNIKLTTKDDLEMFKGYLKSKNEKWLK